MKNYLLLTSTIATLCLSPLINNNNALAFDPNDLEKLLSTKRCIKCNLEEVELFGVDLKGANLTEANLRNAGLSSADLTNAKLERANLTNAALSYAEFQGADLNGANLTDANLIGANVTSQQLLKTILKGTNLLEIENLKTEDIDSLIKAGATIMKDNEITLEDGNLSVNLKKINSEGEAASSVLTLTATWHDLSNQKLRVLDLPLNPDFWKNYYRLFGLKIKDLDGDCIPEVLVDVFTNGAHCCSISRIFTFSDINTDSFSSQYLDHFWSNTGYNLKFNSTTNKTEFHSADNYFAYRFSSFAGSRFPLQIWQYQKGKMIDITRQHPELLEQQAKKLLQEYTELEKTLKEDKEEDYSYDSSGAGGILSAYLAVQYLLNQPEKGWQTLRQLYQGKDRDIFFAEIQNFFQITGYIPNPIAEENLVGSFNISNNDSEWLYRWIVFNSKGDNVLLFPTEQSLQQWDWQTGKLTENREIQSFSKLLDFNEVDNTLLILSEKQLIKLPLNAPIGEPNSSEDKNQVWDFSEGNEEILAAQIIQPNIADIGEVIVVLLKRTEAGSTLTIYAPQVHKIVKTFSLSNTPYTVALDYQAGLLVYSSDDDFNLYVLDINTGKTIHKLTGHVNTVDALAIDKDIFISGGVDDSLKIWDLKSGKLISSWSASVSNIAIHPSGKLFATINSNQRKIEVWRLPD